MTRIAALMLPTASLIAYIQDITHERAWLSSRVDQVVLKVVVETCGVEHAEQMFVALKAQGYDVLAHPLI